jgi:hypothetical protein
MAGTPFAEVLDDALESPRAPLGAREDGFFSQVPLAGPATVYLGLKGVPPAWAATRYPHTAGRRPARMLGPAERHALDELIGLGARLREDFTHAELRSAFRALARRFHPDHCAGQPPADQAHASRTFAFIVGHYRCLASAGDL